MSGYPSSTHTSGDSLVSPTVTSSSPAWPLSLGSEARSWSASQGWAACRSALRPPGCPQDASTPMAKTKTTTHWRRPLADDGWCREGRSRVLFNRSRPYNRGKGSKSPTR